MIRTRFILLLVRDLLQRRYFQIEGIVHAT